MSTDTPKDDETVLGLRKDILPTSAGVGVVFATGIAAATMSHIAKHQLDSPRLAEFIDTATNSIDFPGMGMSCGFSWGGVVLGAIMGTTTYCVLDKLVKPLSFQEKIIKEKREPHIEGSRGLG